MFRSLGKSKIAFVLAILFGLSLFFFRGGDRYSNLFNSDNVVASVSGTPISTSKFLRIMQMNINQYNQMFGRQLSGEEIQAFQIHSMALSQLINNAVFENEFDKKEFIIDETVIAKETKKRFPNLYNKDNSLNELALNSFLSQQNLKIDDVVKIIDFEARSKVFDKLFFEVSFPKKMDDILNKHNKHKRNIELIKFNINDFELPNYDQLDISINNTKLNEYFDQNINSYTNPEKRDISYLLIDKKDFEDQFIPSDNEVQNYYINNKSIFLEPEKRNFIQFNFKKIEEANQFRLNIESMSIQEIQNFANENNIMFNEFTKVSDNEVLEELSSVIFDLDIGEISNVVETPLAKHIVITSEIYKENQKTIDQSFDEILNTLKDVEVSSYLMDLKNKISQEILDGYSLNEIANNNSLKIKNIKNAERNINKIENDIIESEVITNGFAINKDFVSDILDLQENISIIINVDKIEDEKPYELQEVFEKVSNDWIISLKIESIEKKVEEISNSSNSISDLSKFFDIKAKNIDLTLEDINYPSILKNKIFKNKLDQLDVSIVNEDIYISKLKNISFPDTVENKTKTLLISELRGNFGSEIIKNKKISTNDSLIQALISQY